MNVLHLIVNSTLLKSIYVFNLFLLPLHFPFSSWTLGETEPPSKKEKTVWPGVSESRLRNMSPGRSVGWGAYQSMSEPQTVKRTAIKGVGNNWYQSHAWVGWGGHTHRGAARGGLSESKQSVPGIPTWGDLERITSAQAGRATGTPSPQSLASKHQSHCAPWKQWLSSGWVREKAKQAQDILYYKKGRNYSKNNGHKSKTETSTWKSFQLPNLGQSEHQTKLYSQIITDCIKIRNTSAH